MVIFILIICVSMLIGGRNVPMLMHVLMPILGFNSCINTKHTKKNSAHITLTMYKDVNMVITVHLPIVNNKSEHN
jgi:hypothetical protein